jgi:phosphoesterase RecJ-like protein
MAVGESRGERVRGGGGGGTFEPPGRLIEPLLAARRPFLCTHIYPDGDALGSTVALSRILRARGAAPSILLTHPVPEKLSAADREGIAAVLDGEPTAAQSALVAAADAIVVLDTSDPDRLGRLEGPVFASAAPKLLIDHHICPDPSIFDVAWSVPESPSTGNLVLRIQEAVGGELDRPTADALFVAIATDTGGFQFSNATPEAFRAAAVLRGAGVDPEALHREIHERSTPERTRALGEVLAGLETALGGRVAYGTFTAADRARHGVPLEELDGFIDALKQVRGAEIVFLIVELSPGRFKVSLRSKGAVDVHPVASRFGGGGHAKAAGCRLEGTLPEVADRLVAACREVFGERGAAGA